MSDADQQRDTIEERAAEVYSDWDDGPRWDGNIDPPWRVQFERDMEERHEAEQREEER